MADFSVLRWLPKSTAARFSPSALTGFVVFLACLLIVHAPFLTAEQLYYHDSINGLTTIGLFYDRLFSGASWLWSSDLNAGNPLWMLIESAPFLDPVALLVYLICSAVGTNWFLPYQVSAVLWLLLFALGGTVCARRLTRNPWPGVLIFLLLFGGPLTVMSPAQSWGFLMPFRYFPWLVWAYLRLRSDVSTPNVMALSGISALSLAGYQSAYPLLTMMFLVAVEALVNRSSYYRWLAQLLRARYLVWMALPLLAALPTIAYLQYSGYLVVVPRAYVPEEVYIFEGTRFFDGLFSALSVLFKDGYHSKEWHGTTYIGLLAPPLIVHGIQRAARHRFQPAGALGAGEISVPIIAAWFVVTAIVTCGGLGLSEYVSERGSLFGVRNFGFLLTGSLFMLALLAALGFSEILENGCALSDVALNTIIFVIFAAIYYWWVGPGEAPPALLATSIAIFASAMSVLYLLRRMGPAQAVFAASVILLMTIETVGRNSSATTSLTSYVAKSSIARDVGQVLERSPRLAQNTERFQLYRSLDYPISESWPLILAVPAVNKRPAALLPPMNPTDTGVGAVTHFFRMRTYERLVTGQSDPAAIEAVLGVTRPVLELVPRSAFAHDETGGLAFVLRDDWQEGELPDPLPETGEIRVSEFAGDRLIAEIVADTEVVLVYRDNMAPGWTATLNGTDAELLVVDGVNKAVAVPPGQHRVEFIYRPWPYLIAFALRALAMLAAIAALAWLAVRALAKPRAT